ncbi:MAG TPA: hypothetical protein VEZ50_17880 [Nodosilinea sp.]|nr:hypothetical protein [Nodosilinea sp.]
MASVIPKPIELVTLGRQIAQLLGWSPVKTPAGAACWVGNSFAQG